MISRFTASSSNFDIGILRFAASIFKSLYVVDSNLTVVYLCVMVYSIHMTQRSYKYRIYPTDSQKKQLAIDFGCARWVFNHALSMRQKAYQRRGESMNSIALSRHITALKKTTRYGWLKDAASTVITQKLRDMDTAYRNFFTGRAKFPNFKRKNHAQSVRYQLDQRIIDTTYSPGKLLKLTGLGEINVVWSRIPSGKPKMATVSKDATGKHWVSMSIEELILPMPKTKKSVGIDIGIKDVIVTSDGQFSGAPKYTKQYAKQLRAEQKSLSRKKKGSVRWHKQRVIVARVHAKIANSRKDFLHKLTTGLVRDYDFIGIEDLNVSGMLKNRCLSKAVADVGMFELKRQLEYKCAWYGKQLVQISRWAPTTKACSSCGQVHDMPLSKRIMNCGCGLELDRDWNAAINVLKSAGNVGRGVESSGLKAVA